MFELVTEMGRLPLEEGDIVRIHKGMSPVRVSVGEHVSQPSEVFIVTGRDSSLYRTFIVFYMMEPGVHVFYGYEGNPYDPAGQEKVLEGAVQFLEEMGGIIEEVPWERMTAREREEWILEESLFVTGTPEEKDLLEDLEEIQLGDIIEVLEGEEEPGSILEEVPEEVPSPPSAAQVPAGGALPEDADEDGEGSGNGEALDFEEDGDFDRLLKQAFLKPELVRKTAAGKPGPVKKGPSEPESLKTPQAAAEPEEAVYPEEEEVLPEGEQKEDALKDLNLGAGPAAAVQGGKSPSSPEETRSIKAIRFLSRF